MFGAPNLLNGPAASPVPSLIGNAIFSAVAAFYPPPNWGVFKVGTTEPAFPVSSVLELDIGGESVISNYPIEDGSFTTYNKVVMPDTFPIRLIRDGAEPIRAEFLKWLQNAKNSLDLYDVLCPENAYPNVTLVSYRVTRTSESGAALILADCLFQQVRQIPAAYTRTAIPLPENQPSTPTTRVSPVPSTVTVP